MAEYTDDIPNEYPFIFGTNDSLPINNLSDKKLEELVPGHIYLKNWRTGEVSQYIKVEATAFTLTENNELFIAESSGIIYAYSRDGVRGKKLIDLSKENAVISNMVANDNLVFFTVKDTVYRYHIPSGILDKLGTMDTSEPIYFTAVSNTTVKWITETDEHYQSESEYATKTVIKNFSTGECIELYGHNIVDLSEDDGRENSVTRADSYFNDFGTSKCTCHGGSGGTCYINGSCDCKSGSWAGYSGIQCLGYAYDWYKNAFGNSTSGSHQFAQFSFSTNINIALAQLSDMLKQCCYGAHMRLINTSSVQHSMILLNPTISTNYMQITDANRTDSNWCIIQTANFAYSTFVSRYPTVKWVWTRNHNTSYVPGVGYVCLVCGQIS
jgi:hypothetical protein